MRHVVVNKVLMEALTRLRVIGADGSEVIAVGKIHAQSDVRPGDHLHAIGIRTRAASLFDRATDYNVGGIVPKEVPNMVAALEANEGDHLEVEISEVCRVRLIDGKIREIEELQRRLDQLKADVNDRAGGLF